MIVLLRLEIYLVFIVGSVIHSQNACKILHNVYARRNVMSSDLNTSSSQKQTVNTNSVKMTYDACVNTVKKFKQIWISKISRTDEKRSKQVWILKISN